MLQTLERSVFGRKKKGGKTGGENKEAPKKDEEKGGKKREKKKEKKRMPLKREAHPMVRTLGFLALRSAPVPVMHPASVRNHRQKYLIIGGHTSRPHGGAKYIHLGQLPPDLAARPALVGLPVLVIVVLSRIADGRVLFGLNNMVRVWP